MLIFNIITTLLFQSQENIRTGNGTGLEKNTPLAPEEMDKDEILRLKQITGLAALFKDVNFGMAWRPAEDEGNGDN